MVKSEVEQALIALCEPPLATLGLCPLDLECRAGAVPKVRLFIERAAPGASIGFADCEAASEALGPVLDAAPELSSSYELEVSSPGLDRRLRLASHFAGAVGESVRLKLLAAKEGFGANIAGTLESTDGDRLVVNVDGRRCALVLGEVTKANVVWKATETARPGKGQRKGPRKGTHPGAKKGPATRDEGLEGLKELRQ